MDDLSFPEMIHGVTVRSTLARGRIRGIRFGDGIPWNEFTIVTAAGYSRQKLKSLLIERSALPRR